MNTDAKSDAAEPVTHPVEALIEILRKIQIAVGAATKSPAGHTLAAAVGVDPKDNALVLHEFAKLLELSYAARKTIEKAAQGKNVAMFLHPLDRLDSMLGQLNLNTGNAPFKETLSEVLPNLEFGRDLVDRQLEMNADEEELLKTILDTCATLTEEIAASDLPAELTKILVARLEAVRDAALKYRVWGDEFLRSALDSALGTFITAGLDLQPSKWQELRSRMYGMITNGYRLIKIGEDVAKLVGLAVGELSGGEPPKMLSD